MEVAGSTTQLGYRGAPRRTCTRSDRQCPPLRRVREHGTHRASSSTAVRSNGVRLGRAPLITSPGATLSIARSCADRNLALFGASRGSDLTQLSDPIVFVGFRAMPESRPNGTSWMASLARLERAGAEPAGSLRCVDPWHDWSRIGHFPLPFRTRKNTIWLPWSMVLPGDMWARPDGSLCRKPK